MAITIGGTPTETTDYGSSYSDAGANTAPDRGKDDTTYSPPAAMPKQTPEPTPATPRTDPQQPAPTPTTPNTPAPTPSKGADPVVAPPRDPVLDALLDFAKGGSNAKAPGVPQQGGSVYQKSGATAGNPIALIIGVLIAGVLVFLYVRSKHAHKHAAHHEAKHEGGGVRE